VETDQFAKYKRLAVVGGPNSGKTTFVALLSEPPYHRPDFHTDSYMHLPWEDQPEAILKDLANLDTFVLEGVQAARILRKGLEVDAVLFLRGSKAVLNSRQEGMRKTVVTVFNDWLETNIDVPVFYGGLPC